MLNIRASAPHSATSPVNRLVRLVLQHPFLSFLKSVKCSWTITKTVIPRDALVTPHTPNSEKSVMRAPESSSNHVNTSPSSSPESDLKRVHPGPPGPGRKWEEEEGSERLTKRETEWGEIESGRAHQARSKTKVLRRGGQNKHISGGAFSKSCCL